MFVAADRFFRRVRDAGRDERGASLVVVVALMAMGFIVAIVIAGAALFAIKQNVAAKSSVQSFAAAEAGRDAVVSALEIAPESCPVTAQYTADPDSDDPQFSVTLHPSNAADEPTSAQGILQGCPSNGDRWVVLRSTGTAPDGSSTTVDAVYPWERFRIEVAGGGLGYMDSSLTSSWSNTSGDTVIKRGTFTCGGSTTFDGNVFVLGGGVVVRQGTFEYTTCQITGDLYASGDITVQRGCFLIFICGPATLRVGGQVKTLGAITAQGVLESGVDAAAPFRSLEARGNIVTNHANARIEAFNGGAVKSEKGISSSSGPIRAAGDIVANESISAGAEIRSYSGSITARLDITGGSTVRAGAAIQAGRNIDGSGARQADGGDITAVGYIAGSGIRSASGSVLARGDISATGAVTADGGDIRTNGSITGNANRIASGAISAGGGISSTGNFEIRASTGGVLAGGDIVLTGASSKLIAGPNATTPNGTIATSGRIESSGQTTAVDLLALRAIKVDRACQISRDVHAGTTLSFDDVVTGQRSNWNSPTCAVGRNFFAGSASSASTLGTSSGSGNNRTFPNTRLSLASGGAIRVPAGWTPAASNRYMSAGGTVETAASGGTNPGNPSIAAAPTVEAPAVDVPAVFSLVLNEDPEGTWETFDDLQLRTTWVDLGAYTTWPGYTPVGPLTGGRCGTSWLGTGGYVRTILQNAGAITVDGFSVPADVPVVIDATQCGNVSMGTWSATALRRDAVLLVRNVSFTFASFTATAPHHLAIIQVDENNSPQVPVWNPGGDPEPVPNCSAGQNRINMTFTSTGGLDTDVNLLLYSPCGVDGSFASSWRGHIYTHNDYVKSEILTTLVCEPMRVVGVVDLPCDINDIAEFGSMNTNSWRLGDRLSQTEP